MVIRVNKKIYKAVIKLILSTHYTLIYDVVLVVNEHFSGTVITTFILMQY